MSTAHTVVASETLKRADGQVDEAAEPSGAPSVEESYFGRHAPWAAGSPEEQHLRDRLKYLAPGLVGWAWFALNVVYGMFRHLLPFASAIYLAAFATGIGMSGWVGESLRTPPRERCTGAGCLDAGELLPFVILGAALLALSGALLSIRTYGSKRSFADVTLFRLQYLALGLVAAAGAVFALFVALPRVLVWLHDGVLRSIDLPEAGGLVGVAGLVGSAAAWVAKNRRTRWFQIAVAAAALLSAPTLVLVPFVGATYWNAQAGTGSEDLARWVLAFGSAGFLLAMWLLFDEVTSTMHLFYRERLATAFVGYRRKVQREDGTTDLRFEQPPWKDPIDLSSIAEGRTDQVKMPNLVVCTAVNLSGDLPAGRLGASFTFERDWAGGPATGYVPMRWIQEAAGDGVVTLPALMAMSGAAIAPSMGKMTIPALRFLMAVFNLRLGVWVPNPYRHPDRRSAWQLRQDRKVPEEGSGSDMAPKRDRPGALYVFREALGANSLDRRYVYVTDGGHWENLGLVELLRRGCGVIVAIDGSGGDATSFGTLSEALALARADLGVDVTIDLSRMREDDDGNSESGVAVGHIEYPDGTDGILAYVRAVRCPTAPQDVVSYAVKDRKFPNHPTSDQFFNEERFEAYRALGRHLMTEAIPAITTGG